MGAPGDNYIDTELAADLWFDLHKRLVEPVAASKTRLAPHELDLYKTLCVLLAIRGKLAISALLKN